MPLPEVHLRFKGAVCYHIRRVAALSVAVAVHGDLSAVRWRATRSVGRRSGFVGHREVDPVVVRVASGCLARAQPAVGRVRGNMSTRRSRHAVLAHRRRVERIAGNERGAPIIAVAFTPSPRGAAHARARGAAHARARGAAHARARGAAILIPGVAVRVQSSSTGHVGRHEGGPNT